MKRLMVIVLAIVMSALMCVSVCAATGAFDGSPSGKPAPELIYGANESEDCESILSITAYGDRDKLSEDSRLKIEEAYSRIIGTQNLTSLNEYIAQIAHEMGIDPVDLAVSDLFDISATNCSGHNDHGHFDITLKAEVLKNFVCLLHYFDDEWHIVDSAEVTNNGEHLEFDVDQLSPFAIVVNTGDVTTPAPAPEKDSNFVWIIVVIVIVLLAAAGAAFYFFFYKKKKAKKDENKIEG